MSVADDVSKLSRYQIMWGSLAVLGIFAPGILALFLFAQDLFVSLDTFKVVLLAIALGVPPWMTNSAIFIAAYKTGHAKLGEAGMPLAIGFVFASVICYSGLLAAYVFSLSPKEFLVVLAGLHLLTLMQMIRVKKRGYW